VLAIYFRLALLAFLTQLLVVHNLTDMWQQDIANKSGRQCKVR